MKADTFLTEAANTMAERGKTYDQQQERSMEQIVKLFNTATGYELTEADGWLFMMFLKVVRQLNAPAYHHDSALDLVAYSALLAESLSSGQ